MFLVALHTKHTAGSKHIEVSEFLFLWSLDSVQEDNSISRIIIKSGDRELTQVFIEGAYLGYRIKQGVLERGNFEQISED